MTEVLPRVSSNQMSPTFLEFIILNSWLTFSTDHGRDLAKDSPNNHQLAPNG
jgi:hypothetical protein